MKRLKSVSLLFMVMVVSTVLLIGCSKKGFYQGMYHGLQQQEELVHPSDALLPTEQLSYETYLREREAALHRDE
ncbi:MAG: hypothetical protein D3920_01165 [Candidatus Electrothrix sp. AW2]|nr:hypothetical protein [Candidatus Electrothrix gigas]